MTRADRQVLGALASLALLSAVAAYADPAPSDGTDAASSAMDTTAPVVAPAAHAANHSGLESLVPELANDAYRLEPGVRPFQNRLSVSPGFGSFGSDRLFTLRVAYNPSDWLAYEGSIGHDAGTATHAVIHSLSAIVRRPLSGRFQPYLAVGYGMVIVYPGQSVNAASVTKNAISYGGGLECYMRNDLALRADLRQATVFGKQRDREGVVAYDYVQGTVGLAFYRSIQP